MPTICKISKIPKVSKLNNNDNDDKNDNHNHDIDTDKMIVLKNPDTNLYSCIVCYYHTHLKSSYIKHLRTDKHKLNVNPLECINCQNVFYTKLSYNNHMKICNKNSCPETEHHEELIVEDDYNSNIHEDIICECEENIPLNVYYHYQFVHNHFDQAIPRYALALLSSRKNYIFMIFVVMYIFFRHY
jgi:hypothetical protein